jgi:hemolysin D
MMSKSSSNALTVRQRGGADPTSSAILEFQWPSTAIANAPIPRSVRGAAISKAATILVQPLETAIVRSIEVREGQQVKAGEVLAKLDPTFAAADLGALTAQVSSLEAEVSRLQAEAENKPFDYNGLDPDLALQGAIYAHRRAEFTAKVEGYARKFDELAAVILRSQSDAARLGDSKFARVAAVAKLVADRNAVIEVVRQANGADFDVAPRKVTAVEAVEIVSGDESGPRYGSG